MLNNPALDVAIGLVFIYAIFSLIATVATEIISTLLKLRGKNLRNGIMRMLDNGPLPKSQKDNKEDQLPDELSGKFFKQSEVRFLGRISKKGKEYCPSYIKPKTFTRALLSTLDYTYSDKTGLSALKDKLNKNNPTHRQIINMIDEANNDLEKFKELSAEWFNDTMDRVAGWYKRKTQWITLIAAILIAFPMNLNTIEITKKLGTDKKARLEMVEAAGSYVNSYSHTDNLNEDNLARLDSLNTQMQTLLTEAGKMGSILDSKFHLCSFEDWFVYIFGCFLTAVALSLGSPFWFDLLNRFIKLRNAGTQEKTEIKKRQ